jgi:hypothetical protein
MRWHPVRSLAGEESSEGAERFSDNGKEHTASVVRPHPTPFHFSVIICNYFLASHICPSYKNASM